MGKFHCEDEVHWLHHSGQESVVRAFARAAAAERGGKVVGRISAGVHELVQDHMGAGTGQWGRPRGP